MSQIPRYTAVSLALSEVLAELGLNDVVVDKRRRTQIVMETMGTILCGMIGRNAKIYLLGSQSEGTTTRGLKSDLDTVTCFCDKNVIHELSDWKLGVANYLMVEAEDTSPGYCMLQVLKQDAAVPETEITCEHCFRDRQGRILLKNTHLMSRKLEDMERKHGPAIVYQDRNVGVAAEHVSAFACTSQFPVVQQWLSVQHGELPSELIKRHIARSQCFVVPVGSKGSVNEVLEWRISTSLAERCLMFSLTLTQLQVYVLMKMLLKTIINEKVPEESEISSFICKNVLLHCVQNTAPNTWQSHTLIQHLQLCLYTLYGCVKFENCPHFFMRSNNLVARRFTQQAKDQLQTNLRKLLNNLCLGLVSIYIDNVGVRWLLKMNPGISSMLVRPNNNDCQNICFVLGMKCAIRTHEYVRQALRMLTKKRLDRLITLLHQCVRHLEHCYTVGNEIEQSACRLLRPYFYTTLGSVLASESIQNSCIISNETVDFFSRGQNSDVSSSRLKLASVYFCAGEMEKAETTLRDVEGRFDVNVCSPICGCRVFAYRDVLTRVEALPLASDESDIPKVTSACVIFTKAEKNCIPQELQYEMYRATGEELKHRRPTGCWMDLAVVDSLPYLHFLCYKVYGQLERRADRQKALNNLTEAIYTEPNLIHKETALNLLGQCMEQEKKWNNALQFYSWSLKICPRNNAANWHICRLLNIRYRHCHAFNQ